MFLLVVLTLGFFSTFAATAGNSASLGTASVRANAAVPPEALSEQQVTQKEYFDLLKAVLDTARENNEHLKEVITVAGWGATIIVACFAFFGLREIRSFTEPLKAKLAKLEEDYSATSARLSKTLEDKIHRDIRAMVETGFALNLMEMTQRNSGFNGNEDAERLQYVNVVRHLDRALNLYKPEDPMLIAWIEGNRAFCLKRLGRYSDALAAAETAYLCKKTIGDDLATIAFNAACYANLTGNTDKALHWLEISVKEDGRNAADAWDDADLATLLTNPQFQAIAMKN